jgi:predicted alpha/beta superfamily hydrolase
MSKLLFCTALFFVSSLFAACGDTNDMPAFHEVEVVVQVPEGAPAVYLTGNIEELGPWKPDALAMTGEGRERIATILVPAGHILEFKVTQGSWEREAVDRFNRTLPNFTLEVSANQTIRHELVAFKLDPSVHMADWRNSGVLGTLVYWQDVVSKFLSETRHVEIWLPPGYDDDAERHYRVIYMHDGQNLFDPRLANTGVDWGVDEAMMRGAESGLFEPAIVVAAWSSSRRGPEYSPWHDGPLYARFLIEELMPRVNSEFRTLTGPEDTFVMGSSMGGLLSFYLVKEHSRNFSACGCVSSHFPISDAVAASFLGKDSSDADTTPYVLKDIASGDTVPEDVRFFFDYGTETLDAGYGPTHLAVRDWLLAQDRVEGKDFRIQEYDGAAHNEAAWRARLDDQLVWLLGD